VKIILKTVAVKIDSVLSGFIDEKINELAKFVSPETSVLLEIGKTTQHHKKGPFFRAECQIKFPQKTLVAVAVAENIKLAIVEAKEELQRQVERYKEKFSAKAKRSQRVVKKELHLSPEAQFPHKERTREEGV
jgi:ribosomal subunit interface protein